MTVQTMPALNMAVTPKPTPLTKADMKIVDRLTGWNIGIFKKDKKTKRGMKKKIERSEENKKSQKKHIKKKKKGKNHMKEKEQK